MRNRVGSGGAKARQEHFRQELPPGGIVSLDRWLGCLKQQEQAEDAVC
jgi:hypothetical protein